MSYHRGGDGRPRGFGFGGFSLGGGGGSSRDGGRESRKTQIPPHPSSGVSKHGYSTMIAISNNAIQASMGTPRKRPKTEEEYFEMDDDDNNLEYLPAPGSPALERNRGGGGRRDSDSDSDDPLDAYMAGIEKEARKDKERAERGIADDDKDKQGVRDDIEEEDDEESYYRYMEENPLAGRQLDESDDEMEYDEDGNPIPQRKKWIDPLPPCDHSAINYDSFEKNFYQEHEDIARLNYKEVDDLRAKLGIRVSGAVPPKPASSFGHFGFDEALMKAIRKSEYTQPTPIQAQGVPIAMSGRDLIGIAKTGSGKTAAFLWPMLVHIMDQKELKQGDGPIGLILAPTRELSLQIYQEAKRFGKPYNIACICCYGGGSKWEQTKALESGAEIVVATPGRIIDLIKAKATNLSRVTLLVLDEADRMFDMGFEPQVRSICEHVRPDRQCLMFSATFKKRIERLARDALSDPIRIVQGDIGEANADVAQHVKLMPAGGAKWNWLIAHLVEFTSYGSVLIFVTKKVNAVELHNNLKNRDLEVGLLHGDMEQTDRNEVILKFKKQEMNILVATDVAARGLDFPHIKTVINFDVARDIDTHTHRVGRTGRAGETGTAYTLVTDKDKEFAGHLVRNLEGASQDVPQDLMDLAMQSSWFRKSRFKGGKGKKLNVGGRGLGYRERPGLGSTGKSNNTDRDDFAYGSAEKHSSKDQLEGGGYVSRAGPGSDRLSALRAAFHAQYKQQFTEASVETSWKIGVRQEETTKKRTAKKSRWE